MKESKFIGEKTPINAQLNSFDNCNSISDLKQKIGDTLSFLHQERNDFLPNDEIALPLTNTEAALNTATIVSSTPHKTHENDSNFTQVQNEIPSLGDKLADAANEQANILNRTIDDSCSILLKKSEEAFSFLEHEDDKSLSPIIEIPTKNHFELPLSPIIENNTNHVKFDSSIGNGAIGDGDKSKSAIPKLKQNKKEKYLKDEKDVDLLLSQEEDSSLSPSESDLLSRIPVAASKNVKVKTIKKHSKDPLKEFVKLVNADGTWDETKLVEGGGPATIYEQTTITTCTSSTGDPVVVQHTTEINNAATSPKSKIPVLMEATKLSPTQESKREREIVDSDSDTDSRQSPPLRGILKKSSMRTLGSSSGSDIALHEAGGELSDDDTGNFNFFSFI